MIILIPMAGKSSRFLKAGYEEQKFRLLLEGKPVFDHAVGSFAGYFDDAEFLFVTRSTYDAGFAKMRAAALGINNAQTYIDRNPQGFHDSVSKSLIESGVDLNQSIILHVADTFRPAFALPDDLDGRGYIESCYKDSDNLRRIYKLAGPSLTEPLEGRSEALKVKEWAALLRGTGLYYFPCAAALIAVYETIQKKRERSPLLSRMMSRELLDGFLFFQEILKPAHTTGFRLINRNDVIFCGTPKEYDELQHAIPR